MSSIFEQTGTISVESGSVTVTGTDTLWIDGYDGVALVVMGKTYPVASIDSPNKLTLLEPFPDEGLVRSPYTFLPVKNENYQLSKDVRKIIDIAGELVDATVGPPGPEGPKGPIGPSGKNGDAGFGAIVNFTEYTGQPAGGTGVYMIVPIAQGDPGITLTQSAKVVLPKDKANAGIGLWVNMTTSGYAITLGLTNAPEPQPEVPSEPIDLSGSSTIYGAPGTVIPLGINVGGSTASFTVNRPEDLPIAIERRTDMIIPSSSQWRLGGSGSPYAVAGDAVPANAGLSKTGGDSYFEFRNGNVVLKKGGAMITPSLGLDFKITSDDAATQTPPALRMGYRGVVPVGTLDGLVMNLMNYETGGMEFGMHWTGVMYMAFHRPGGGETVYSPASDRRVLGTLQTYEAQWEDNIGGAGGYVTFFIDGVQVGERVPTERKPRVATSAVLELNASVGNTSNGVDNLELEWVKIEVGKPGIATTYEVVNDGPISRTDLEALVVDARAIFGNQAARTLSYTANGTQRFEVEIIVGEMALPAGRAYKAVLEDWSSGAAVEHPNHLVMTRPIAQNCKFEDANLYGTQATWTEVLPQGPVPNINGINYYCEGIRMGTYVQFQFGYDWDETSMPANPFGNPTGRDSYMVPHKWKIFDSAGTLLARIEKPNGEPLNGPSTGPVWEGETDGRGIGRITSANPFYPHGTVRSGVIWRSHDPVAYSQEQVWKTIPVYDMRVPFACATGFSVNGGDMRLFGEGQVNGFGNYRVMSWEPTTYNDIQIQAAATQNAWKNSIFTASGAVPNAGLWLKYTPFNIMGRSPVTGPGGARDDRQIMPEMVAVYARDVNAKRPHDGRSMKEIALDYLTGYVSDPYHAFEKGRNVPLFKGNPRRAITMRNHYYGAGEATTPEGSAYYIQGGRPYDWARSYTPLRVNVPSNGFAANKPIFGTHQIDEAHAHQFPHWGSMLFQTPEFAFLGHKFYDQAKLYNNIILASQWSGAEFYERGAAWKFLHAALAWKTASSNSSRLYSRKDVMDFVTVDFEKFYDTWYAIEPGFLNPPTNIMVNGQIDGGYAMYAAAARFGPCTLSDAGVHAHDFFIGYWLSALHVAERIGFNDALRAASPKVKAIIDWLIAMHRKRIVGRINEGMTIACTWGSDYLTTYWTEDEIRAAGGDVSKLHQNMAQVAAARPSPSWDVADSGGALRDGQAMDQLLAGPALMKDMGASGADLDQAVNRAEQLFQEKLQEETARGSGQAGEVWFKYHQSTNNRPWRPG